MKRFFAPDFSAKIEAKFPLSLWVTLPYVLDEPNHFTGTRDPLYSVQCAQELTAEWSTVDSKERENSWIGRFKNIKRRQSIWDQSRADDREAELNGARDSRLNAIVSKLNSAGWSAELAHEESLAKLSQHKLVKQPKPLTERIWKNIGPKLIRLHIRNP
ncbi:hypothetical protein VNI00_003513 [Paramarasmius palmivorus]|uniref:Uncharacterized protein n=1 Tax=Paramarasmius palmivorus TaxID=297713 RepID=A0AAW0DSQ3_9AGAR